MIMEKALPSLNVIPKGAMVVKSEFDSAPRREASGPQPLIDEIKVGKGMATVVMRTSPDYPCGTP